MTSKREWKQRAKAAEAQVRDIGPKLKEAESLLRELREPIDDIKVSRWTRSPAGSAAPYPGPLWIEPSVRRGGDA